MQPVTFNTWILIGSPGNPLPKWVRSDRDLLGYSSPLNRSVQPLDWSHKIRQSSSAIAPKPDHRSQTGILECCNLFDTESDRPEL